ncbi:PCNA-interacting partner isoform X2 [Sphaerodactylus townsendi]|uniref:PCNA-interacting partner isoform X2 n=1 Tax=Sphaerodactylus townsendi TaxID=933632 RepID=UPI0020263254|nr:PCNA-interacting partner isoform X2 [Sphaerodactylus townsendi]
MTSLQQRILKMVQCFRKEWRLFSDSERTTVCGADCMLMALQLAVAEVNKKHCNMMDIIDVYQKCGSLEGEENCISPVQLLEFITKTSDSVSDNTSVFPAPSTPTNRLSQDNKELSLEVKKTLYAYLSLLVNSKNDLAFARILNIPDRGLGREAFTDLKHAAQKRQMSIFPMATSFIRTIELGGKGYAPSPVDPLRKHMKGLSHLVHFIDKLDEIVGEVPDPRLAGGKILSTIKMHLIKGRNSRDSFCRAVEEVICDLELKIKNILNFQHDVVAASSTGISPVRPKLHAINHDTVYCGRDTVKFLLVLLDEAATHLPATNKAELLFDDKCGFPSTLMLYKSPAQSSGSSPKVLRERIQKAIDRRKLKLKQPLIRSQFACTYKDDQTSEKKDGPFSTSQIPTCIHPAPKERTVLCPLDASSAECLRSHLASAALGTSSGNVHQNGSRSKEIGKSSCQPRNESSKRKQVDRTSENVICANENESLQHVHRKRPKAAVKCQNSLDSKIKGAGKCNKVSAKNKLIVGQAKLTRFFEL